MSFSYDHPGEGDAASSALPHRSYDTHAQQYQNRIIPTNHHPWNSSHHHHRPPPPNGIHWQHHPQHLSRSAHMPAPHMAANDSGLTYSYDAFDKPFGRSAHLSDGQHLRHGEASGPPSQPAMPSQFQNAYSGQSSWNHESHLVRSDVEPDSSPDENLVGSSKDTNTKTSGTKTVARAACLSCRVAKRRCDGVQPVCGPCASRGVTVESHACRFVASKRGGPRFKGCTGEEAKRIKAEKEQKKLERAVASGNGASSISPAAGSRPEPLPPGPPRPLPSALADAGQFLRYPQYTPSGSLSRGSSSMSSGRPDHEAERHATYVSAHSRAGTSFSTGAANSEASKAESSNASTSQGDVTGPTNVRSASSQASRALTSPRSSHELSTHPPRSPVEGYLSQSQPQKGASSTAGGPQGYQTRTPSDAFVSVAPPNHAPSRRDGLGSGEMQMHHSGAGPSQVSLQPEVYADGSSALSSANLELWQKIQNDASASTGMAVDGSNGDHQVQIQSGLNSFWARLEQLPKAGQVGDGGPHAPIRLLQADSEDQGIQLDSADSEQQARFLLTAFFEKVYASAPVLLAPENLSSLAFWFSGKGPCALYAAISALVTLRLPESEARKTLRGGYQQGADGAIRMSRAEIAAHHARMSQFLLRRFSQQQAAAAAASFGLDPSALSTGCDPDESGRALCQGPLDPELLRIEAAAAHTLLCHYFYSAGGHAAQSVAHEHALEAWNSLQGIQMELQEGVPPVAPLATSHFNWEQKQEWAKRVYWTSFAAASVTACTGGFNPIRDTCDAVTALKLRPALASDVGAWGVYIRGAQHVARGYTALHELTTLKDKVAKHKKDGHPGQEGLHQERARIYRALLKLDRDMTTFSAYDPAWRSEPRTVFDSGHESLGYALRTAGKLMTAGATVIIHRGQAFANAQIFMHPQCGLPQAARLQSSTKAAEDSGLQTGRLSGAAALRGVAAGKEFNAMDIDTSSNPPSPSLSYVAPGGIPDRLWHRSGSFSLPPAGTPDQEHQQQQFPRAALAQDRSMSHSSASSVSIGHTPNGEMGSYDLEHFHLNHVPRLPSLPSCGMAGGAGSGSRPDSRVGSVSVDESKKTFEDVEYAHGPFDPEHSIAKCKWAAESMLESVRILLQTRVDEQGRRVYPLGNHADEAPSLPPWAACSYVLGGYCVLMQCLVVQAARAWKRTKADTKRETGAQSSQGASMSARDGSGAQMSVEEAAQSGSGLDCVADSSVTSIQGNAGSMHSSAESAKSAKAVTETEEELEGELKRLQEQVSAIYSLLGRFAQTHNIAKEYQSEVGMLLDINKKLQ